MPIPRSRVADAQRPLGERILEFLQQHRDDAYRAAEIAIELEGEVEMLALAPSRFQTIVKTYIDALKPLVGSGLVIRGMSAGLAFYCAADPV